MTGVCTLVSQVSTLKTGPRDTFYEGPNQGLGDAVVSTGRVKWFNASKGFGFICPDDGGEDLFVYHSEIRMNGYATLEEDQKVSFQVGQGKKGPCATDVVPL